MDGRDGYPDDPEPGWYSADQAFGVPRWRDGFAGGYGAGDGRRQPEPVGDGPSPAGGAPDAGGGAVDSRGVGSWGAESDGGVPPGGYPGGVAPFAGERFGAPQPPANGAAGERFADAGPMADEPWNADGRQRTGQWYAGDAPAAAETPSVTNLFDTGRGDRGRGDGGARLTGEADRPMYAAYPTVTPLRPDRPSPVSGAGSLETPTGPIAPISSGPWRRQEPTGPGGPGSSAEPTIPAGDRPGPEPVDREPVRRAPGSSEPVGDGVYRGRRPAVAVLFAVLAAGFEIPALRVFLDGAFGGPASSSGVVAGMCLVLGLPLLAAGLYGLVTGATAAAGSARVWPRPPVGYLPIGLVLLIAAALAA